MFTGKEDPWIIVQALLQLYMRTVMSWKKLYIYLLLRPHLEYGCVILEKVQHFACKPATKCWDASYEELIGLWELPTLEERWVHMKLCLLYKIINELCYFPSWVFLTGTILIMLDLIPCHCISLLPKLMPITFLLYPKLYLCGTHWF